MFSQNREYDCATDALFLDLDGASDDLASEPVPLAPQLLAMLACLQHAAGGAVALLSARPLRQLDQFVPSLRLPAAGMHGRQRRTASGHVIDLSAPKVALLMERLSTLVARHAGLFLEPRDGVLVLHYRQAPYLEQACVEAMHHAIRQVRGFRLLRGEMMVQANACDVDEVSAMAAFMTEPPFNGRRPLFAGTGLSDEAGFAWAQAACGVGIKIGAGESQAQRRLDSLQNLFDWLGQGLDRYT